MVGVVDQWLLIGSWQLAVADPGLRSRFTGFQAFRVAPNRFMRVLSSFRAFTRSRERA